MGRRKIEIKPILHERNRSVTFLKRKNGLFKKAHELGVLCSVQVAVIIFEERPGHNLKLYQYCSSDVRDMIQRHMTFDGERDTKGPADFASSPTHLFDGHDDDDDDQDEEEEVDTRGVKRRVDGKVKPLIAHTGLSVVDMDYGRRVVQQGISASTHNRQTQVPGASPSLPVSSDRHSVLHENPHLPSMSTETKQQRLMSQIPDAHLSMSTETRSPPGSYTLRSPSNAAGQGPFPYFPTQTPPPPGSFVTNFNRSPTSRPAYRPRGGNSVAPYETGVYQQMIAQQGGTNATIFGFMGEDSHGNTQNAGGGGSPNTGNWLDFLSNNPPAGGGNGNIASAAATSSSAPGATRRSSDSWERNSRPGSGGPPRGINDTGGGKGSTGSRMGNVEIKTEAQDGI